MPRRPCQDLMSNRMTGEVNQSTKSSQIALVPPILPCLAMLRNGSTAVEHGKELSADLITYKTWDSLR